ncbi:bacteriophage endolysin (N-acetylmuramoyl-L-alanine amidase) [Clostridium perfringens A]|uniref:N-acetylmuramoyl-L-alanine amidase n=2 Tax=Clostridium perfringens TaxID=1502 RepID=UPI001B83DE98|nr:N-acetylmuramoyl-L-alanine amidase [Clostridium perfringens]HBC2034857.1 N-acetylmuramoyl-L-alanine amidase [Clostridium perfringens]HBC2058005.1 N-acetylmuramoyl-L-alanine amidase [Clostridium perfringens]HBC2072208.1 N-acetylmuramoyl-L-alanine amidase [Clostridium perfringens]
MSKLILIDCGHCLSGADTGATGLGYREEVLTRQIGKRLKNILEKAGYEVIIVSPDSSTSVNQSLSYRTNLANKYPNALVYISIHLNSFSGGTANGVEVLINARGGNAEKYAKRVQNKLVSLGYYNRAVKVNSGLYVLRKTTMPAILCECGFINNERDMNLYDHNKIAEAIAEGVLNMELDTSTAEVSKPQEVATTDKWFTTKNVDTSLNIRNEGTTSSAIVGTIPKGAKFKFNYVNSDYLGWLCITYNGITGYVSAKYAQEVREEVKPVVKYGEVTASVLNVRDGAGTEYNDIGDVYEGEKVIIKWTVPGWHYIVYNTKNGTKEGYVYAKYIEIVQ